MTDIPALPQLVDTGPLALCSLQDIAGTLGYDDVDEIEGDQLARIPYLLAKLCRLFRIEAGREFTPGQSTVQILSCNGRIVLPDPLGEKGTVDQVMLPRNGNIIPADQYTIRNNSLYVKIPVLIGYERPGTGEPFEITYTHTGEVPWDVRATIAAAVARYLTVDPNSAVAQSTFLSSDGYHQRIATWVADVVKLNPDDIALARHHRSLPVNLIVQKIHGYEEGRTDWSMWSWGGVTLW
jgi:hypothetical protein